MELKQLEISEEIRADADLSAKVRTASDVLIDVLGRSAGIVGAEWDCGRDQNGRPLVELILHDPWGTNSIPYRFAPDELRPGNELWRKLYRIWGDHLQTVSDRKFEKLHETVQALEG